MLLAVLAVGVLLFLARCTNERGKTDLQSALFKQKEGAGEIKCIAPLLLCETDIWLNTDNAGNVVVGTDKSYFLWFFGSVHELPLQKNFFDKMPPDMSDQEFDKLLQRRR